MAQVIPLQPRIKLILRMPQAIHLLQSVRLRTTTSQHESALLEHRGVLQGADDGWRLDVRID